MVRLLLLVSCAALLLHSIDANAFQEKGSGRPSPVILVPGDGGSQLEARLNKPESVHYFCNKKSDGFFNLWLNLELLVPYVLDCWVDNMRLIYDNVTRTTRSPPGVEIRIPGFGNTSSVDWLDPSQISPSAYFVNIIEMLRGLGYQSGQDVRGAPYDFRKAPNELGDFFADLKNLTEDTFARNGGARVTLVCHSMGCPLCAHFLGTQTQAWKDARVKALVSLGGAWGGAVKALKTFAAGENLGVFVISQANVRREQRTSPSLAYVLPSDQLWGPSEVVVATDRRNYTVRDFSDFFNDIGFPLGYQMFKDTMTSAREGLLNPPGVEVHCLHGLNVTDTIDGLDFRGTSDFPDNPKLVLGDGDGTVNVRSLQACTRWAGKQKQRVLHVPLPNVDHMGILAHPAVVDYIRHVVTQ